MALSHVLISPLRAEPISTNAHVRPWLAHLLRMRRNWHTRRQLLELDTHLLRDIGLTRDQAIQEATRLPWDPPPA
jgi:uncharacterized protein YjiS (DUF1127 family)